MDDVIERTETVFRSAIRTMPDGRYDATIEMDGDGVDPAAKPVAAICFEVDGDRLIVSFDGSSEAVKGPINLPAIGTRAHVSAALKGLIMPDDAANEGHFRGIEFVMRPGSMVSAERPSPCDCYGYVGVALMHLTLKALADALPDRCPAGGYQLFSVYLHRVDPRHGEPFNFIDILAGGDGARPNDDGPTLIFVGAGDVSNTPVEILETRYPIRCERYELHPSVAGAGRHLGGFGLRRDLRILAPGISIQVSVENAGVSTAQGVAGGRDGAPSAVVVWPGTERETWIREKTTLFGPLEIGDVVSARSGGGGGWGPPHERDPRQVEADLRNEYVTQSEANGLYGLRDGGLAQSPLSSSPS
jgi:N-methylhydantoinase B